MTTTELALGQTGNDVHTTPVEGTQLPRAQDQGDDQSISGAGTQTSEPAIRLACPQITTAGSDPTSGDPTTRDTQSCSVAGPNLTDSHPPRNDHGVFAVGEPSSPAPITNSTPGLGTAQGDSTSTGTGHGCPDAQTTNARPGGFLRDPVIGVLADVLDDLEKVRIANANRVRILTRNEADSDGENRGFGLTEDHPEVKKLILTVKALEAAEHDAILNLQRALRKHPLAAFQKRHKGLGEKQFARLIAVIGDPYWNDLHDRPRTVSELWAYCGFHVLPAGGHSRSDPHCGVAAAGSNSTPTANLLARNRGSSAVGVAPKRARGQQSNWSEDARKRVWVIASAMPKFPGGHYEQVYRQAREKYADATHPTDCVRCGPAGKPALAGSDLSDGHKHARAVRIVAKELLKDMWRESKSIYEEQA
ncbi:hypothetical protein SEA_SPOOKY_50 [Gordonia phage Spooky]|nr:hypothetical protein SEA_SPOOKY_50 [Gordonia phage Spooky]